ncbi:MAG: hypothetical protein JG781_271 [Peptococcaceae bacterium]|jgi:hypothetical protein|nr:hypothetical protein [Peptococcaceae bacterium]
MPRKIDDRIALFSILLAALFWYLTFSVQLVNFWLSMSLAAAILTLLAIRFGGLPFTREEFTLRAVLIGLGSAVLLYLLFWLGNFFSQLLFNFAKPQISSIYEIRNQAEAILISLILLFITSPGEELFWRNFLQRWAMERFREPTGWLLGSMIYAGVHISSGNFMLIMAALMAGLFWGYIYWREKSVVPVMISHALWTVGIFVLFPVI